ncbi:6090_t:CDS:2 [Entrophospora sp. SA101]|nr:8220_t:CDS:2 [Entrophospora sp. SA101]CAJ0639594.1 6090_t:CDS:2 [Entrophospora sp. SA101]CAJ0839312.1 10621_t:CDS:2 [Entrophospora sp. SA101]CAJ0857424.1 1749_t:CDS:2 [Entrophospora sp. SA101]
MWPPIDKLPEVQSFIGVIFAVTGNILISIALNLQKHAHNELQRISCDSVAFSDTRSGSNPQRPTSLYDSDLPTHILRSSESDDSYVMLTEFDDCDNKSHYLFSKAWWAGILLMVIGESGNFIAYGFAPASVVAPLGTVALISNVILAPIMLKERFRTQDLFGVVVAIIGAIIVVLNSKSEEVKLSPEAICEAILQVKFRIYLIVTVILTSCLLIASIRYGHRLIFIDLSLVAIFGGYTVLATKSISSLLTLTFISMFTYPITYLLFFVLLSTAVLQIKYLNKSLSQFDSTEVIPTQFVLFTISAIIGSAVLYNDFADMDFWRCTGFLVGCLLTFLGVFFITSNRNKTRGYTLISTNPTQTPNPISAITDDDGVYNSPIDFDGHFSFNTHRPISSSTPRRHTLNESIDIATPLLHGELYPANYSHSRSDSIFKSLVDVSATTITGVGQALNSVGARHSHALGLDSSYLGTSFTNSEYYNSGYNTESIQEDYESDDVDDTRTISGLTISTDNSGNLSSGLYSGEEYDDDNESGSYDVFSNYGADDMDGDLPDLPSRNEHNINNGETRNENES